MTDKKIASVVIDDETLERVTEMQVAVKNFSRSNMLLELIKIGLDVMESKQK